MNYLGIDPGQGGGLALVRKDGALVRFERMPQTERDILDLLSSWTFPVFADAPVAILEFVRASPQMGVTSAFTFGCGYGGLRMALTATGIPFSEVTPKKWQGVMQCRTGGDKNVTKRRAQELFPLAKVTHAVADAILLAEYARRLHLGIS